MSVTSMHFDINCITASDHLARVYMYTSENEGKGYSHHGTQSVICRALARLSNKHHMYRMCYLNRI